MMATKATKTGSDDKTDIILHRDKLTVFGYVRQKINERNIPLEIINIILEYFLTILDSWNIAYGEGLNITDELKMEHVGGHKHVAAFGNLIIKQGEIYKWKLKVTKYAGCFGNSHTPYIGVIKSDADLSHYKTRGHNFKNDGYLFCCGKRQILRPIEINYGKGESTYFNKVGDIIEIRLDLIDYTLSYTVNGVDCGIAYSDIQKCNYRLGVNQIGNGNELQIIP